MSANSLMLRFFRAARGAGVRVSPAESIDAMRAMAAIGYSDRERMRDTLVLTLAKSKDEKESLTECFDLFFRSMDDQGEDQAEDDYEEPQGEGVAQEPSGEPNEGVGNLAQMLLGGNRAETDAAMSAAGDAVNLSDIRFFTQRGIYSRRILDRMGMEQLERDIAGLMAVSDARAQRLANVRDALRERVRDYVNQAVLLYTREGTEELRNEVLRNTPLNRLEPRDVERTRSIVRAIARRLCDRYNKPRRKKNRGRLDTRKTIRRNASWGGIPFITEWKQKKIEKPKLVVLCDVSGSVARVVEFLLLFLYSLNDAVSDIRTYAFSSNMVDVGDILESNEIQPAMEAIMKRIGFGSSDYGKSFADFEENWMQHITQRSTVIILGDARNNNLDPRVDILRRISERSKRIIWLNPESRFAWGTGDSEMPRYEPFCKLARPCGTVQQLERVVSDLMAMDRH